MLTITQRSIGHRARLQKLQSDYQCFPKPPSGEVNGDESGGKKAIPGLHNNDECMYGLEIKAKRLTSIGFKVIL